jgi:zinc/manganese transport system substrate-binding protein
VRWIHPPLRAAGVASAVTALLVAAVALSGCGGPSARSSAGPAVVATTTILADITHNVACGKLEVPSVIPAGADAHAYEATVQDADRLDTADLVVANGLGLEEGLTDALGRARDDGVAVLSVGRLVRPLPAAAATGERGPDPHVWMDPDRMATAAEAISRRLQRVGGLAVPAADVQRCGREYAARLRALGTEMDGILAAVPPAHRKLVTNHEALGYFADRFDFDVIGAVVPSTSSLGESNPRDLEELATAVRRAGVPAVFAETTQPDAVARALADRVGGPVEVVDLYTEALGRPGSGASTYESMMRTAAQRVAAGLAG